MKNSRNTPLKHGGYYHIYNRGNNGEQLFYKPENYTHFLRLYEKYIDPIADTYAWCLMGNHFHLLVRIKEKDEINMDSLPNPVRVQNPNRVIKPPHRYFSDLFNSYSQAINKQEGRTGSLLESPFRRIPITSDKYFQNLVVYIHRNPVHHGFTDDYRDYPWSSYGSIISDKTTRLRRKEVVDWFDNRKNFIYCHSAINDFDSISHLIID